MKTIKTTTRTKMATALAAAMLTPFAALALGSSTADGAGPAGSVEEAVSKEVPFDADPPPGAVVTVVENGYRRVVETVRIPVTPEELAEMKAAGKTFELDSKTGELITKRIRDYLPANWGAGSASGERVDSYGNPIVNITDGLPDWAQRDVDALRQAIVDTLLHRQNLLWALAGEQERIERTSPLAVNSPYTRTEQDMSGNLFETEGVLGNYIGQTISRGIAFDDLVDLFDVQVVTDGVADSILDYLHFYENLKFVGAERSDHSDCYTPSTYDPTIEVFAAAHGRSMEAVLALDETDSPSSRATPSGCYPDGFSFTRGMLQLSGATIIWDGSGDDDSSADVPIGFRSYFYSCDDPDEEFNVRVSTNGYLSFFEQGGGALNGTAFSNVPITHTNDPDGYVAPFWDDLWIAPNQGLRDKVSYKTEGSIPSRVFTVEWLSVSRLAGDTNDLHSFQVQVKEQNNDIRLHFGTWLSDFVDSGTIGMEDFDGLDGDCGPNCDNHNQDSPNNYLYRWASAGVHNDCFLARCLDTVAPVTGTTFGGHGLLDDTSCAFGDYFDVWYEFTPTSTAAYAFDTCGSGFDTTLAVFDECSGSGGLNELACNDDTDWCAPGSIQSLVNLSLTAGEDYFIRLSGYNGGRGDFLLTATGLMGGDSVPCGCAAPRPYGDVSPFGSIVPPCPGYVAELGDGFANMLDVFCAFNAFNDGFPYAQCPCADVAPCGGDTFVNMQDVFAIFSAFNDSPACSAPCP